MPNVLRPHQNGPYRLLSILNSVEYIGELVYKEVGRPTPRMSFLYVHVLNLIPC